MGFDQISKIYHDMPLPLIRLFTILLLLTSSSPVAVQASPSPKESWGQLRGLSWNALFGRGSSCVTSCGWAQQLCCAADEACYTDSNEQAQCSKTTAAVVTTQPAVATSSGYWHYYTTVFTQTDLVTITSTYSSSWCPTTAAVWAPATATASASCNYALNESPCGSICCASDQYCFTSGQCKAAAGAGSSGYYSTYTASTQSYSAPLRPTSSTLVVVTATNSPTTTVPFVAPVATGANITLTSSESNNSGGLSGGAIAGIVIGVLAALALLALLCLFCCFRGIWHLIFGGGKKRRTERTEYYESHRHASGGGGAAGRTWYGSRPTRVETGREKKKSDGFGGLLGVGAGLAGLAAILGLKRKHDRRHDEKSDISSNYYSYYTSESKSL